MHSKYQRSESVPTAWLLAIVGGYLDVYTFICRDGVFANAQTGNFARMSMEFAQGNFYQAIAYLVPITAFVLGITLGIQMRKWFADMKTLHWRHVVIALETMLLTIVAMLPIGRVTNVIANTLVSLTCAIQFQSFRKVLGNAFASTMCTGNLRMASVHLNAFFEDKNKKTLKKCITYFAVDIMFVMGGIIGTISTNTYGYHAAWACPAVLILVFIVMIKNPESLYNEENEIGSGLRAW